jgi:hypothetical protein
MKIVFLFLLSWTSIIFSQPEPNRITGKVTYLSSQNVYVEFSSTKGMNVGDTIYLSSKDKLFPVIEVLHISSKSISGKNISKTQLNINDLLYAYTNYNEFIVDLSVADTIKSSLNESIPQTEIISRATEFSDFKRNVRGKFSVQSYSSILDNSGYSDFQRWRYSFSYYTNEFYEGKLIFNNYMIYSYKNSDPDKFKLSSNRHLKIYDLSLKYLISENSSVAAGRFIDNAVSNIGAVDGILYKHNFPFFEGGVIAGKRPNWNDNSETNILPQFGFFLSRNDTLNGSFTSNSFALFQQMYKASIDRRFIYFQHYNDFIPLTQINFSSEIDFFSMNKGIRKSELSLTSLYFNARITASKIISFNVSYDARKNVVYVESFKSFIDSLFENETRQGFKIGTNIRPVKNVFAGLNFGHRFMKGDINSSSNYSGYITWSHIPYLSSSITINFAKLHNSYSNGRIASLRMNKSFFDELLSTSIYFSNAEWALSKNNLSIIQNFAGLEISQNLFGKTFLMINGEFINSDRSANIRVVAELSIRF